MKKPVRRYAEGGEVTKAPPDMLRTRDASPLGTNLKGNWAPQPIPNAPLGITQFPAKQQKLARGGMIKQVAGKPIGKDDGIIAAQRGEFVVKKAAVNKLGTGVMNTINRGKLPMKKSR